MFHSHLDFHGLDHLPVPLARAVVVPPVEEEIDRRDEGAGEGEGRVLVEKGLDHSSGALVPLSQRAQRFAFAPLPALEGIVVVRVTAHDEQTKSTERLRDVQYTHELTGFRVRFVLILVALEHDGVSPSTVDQKIGSLATARAAVDHLVPNAFDILRLQKLDPFFFLRAVLPLRGGGTVLAQIVLVEDEQQPAIRALLLGEVEVVQVAVCNPTGGRTVHL